MEQVAGEETSLAQRVTELEAFVGRMQDLLDHDFTSDTARVRAIREAVERGPQGAKALAEFSYRAEVAQRIARARPDDSKAAQIATETRREAELAKLLVEEREINLRLQLKEAPTDTGVGVLCAPGPVASQVPAFLLRFEDQDRPDLVLYDRGEARAAFAKSEARGWNCYLFELMKRHDFQASN